MVWVFEGLRPFFIQQKVCREIIQEIVLFPLFNSHFSFMYSAFNTQEEFMIWRVLY